MKNCEFDMSLLQAQDFLEKFCARYVVSLPKINLSRSQKIIIICITGSTLLLGSLAQYLKRRRRHPIPPSRRLLRDSRQRLMNSKASNYDAVSQASWARRSEVSTRSHISDRASLISSVPGGLDGDAKLTPQQYGVLGLESLERALYCWEDALTAFSSAINSEALALPSKADAKFTRDVQELLDLGFQMQNQAEALFIDQVADLREFEEFSEFFPHFEQQKLYHAALKQHEDNGIPCRMTRSGNEKRLHTELVKCGSDVEYLAKVHCLRQAYTRLFGQPSAATWIADVGRQLISDLIIFADREPKEYLTHYERMLEFLTEESSLDIMDEELSIRGVRCINFYDVVIDFILLDAFEEVEKPPSSIKAILQNRWISASFRETAIGTAVWSVLMGKRQMLKYPRGFMAHFYSISEQVTPVLVWGFLGPESSLRSTCYYFREQIVEFLQDIFNFFKVRYTNVDDLAEDVLREMKIRVENINQRLSLEGC
ncbi:mitoguardin isoform X3 [Phymastichus coffea]|uniref:mitoguardin isoform X3 n=1 Tax=Phymastichus coffea TaxID=108790 RepID=UPI00273B07E5|nr:mitoguardin isoform X3 [Phymastichus coffea]